MIWDFVRYRLTELALLAVLAVFAVQSSPAWWVVFAVVVVVVGRQEWRTRPGEPVRVPEDTDISVDQERERAEERA